MPSSSNKLLPLYICIHHIIYTCFFQFICFCCAAIIVYFLVADKTFGGLIKNPFQFRKLPQVGKTVFYFEMFLVKAGIRTYCWPTQYINVFAFQNSPSRRSSTLWHWKVHVSPKNWISYSNNMFPEALCIFLSWFYGRQNKLKSFHYVHDVQM